MPRPKTVMLWDSAKQEIIGEFSFSLQDLDWESGCKPKPLRISGPFSASQSSWPPKTFEPSRQGEGASPRREFVSAWINPSLAVPALALIGVQGGKFKFSIVNYLSGAVLYDWAPAPWGDATVATGCFSSDGSTFGFLHQDMLYIYLFSTDGDGCICVTFHFLPMENIYCDLKPTV